MINQDHMKLQEGKLWGYGCVSGVTAVKNSVKGMDGVLQLVACLNVATVATLRRCLASTVCVLWYSSLSVLGQKGSCSPARVVPTFRSVSVVISFGINDGIFQHLFFRFIVMENSQMESADDIETGGQNEPNTVGGWGWGLRTDR